MWSELIEVEINEFKKVKTKQKKTLLEPNGLSGRTKYETIVLIRRHLFCHYKGAVSPDRSHGAVFSVFSLNIKIFRILPKLAVTGLFLRAASWVVFLAFLAHYSCVQELGLDTSRPGFL